MARSVVWRDAYPDIDKHLPAEHREDDELWDAMEEEPLPEDNPTHPEITPPSLPHRVLPFGIRRPSVHRHQLCGHECASGACTGLEAICISCEFDLQDAYRPPSRGMDRRRPGGP